MSTAESIRGTINEMRSLLADGTCYRPLPHRAIINTAGDRHGVVDATGCVVTMDSPGAARLYAAAPSVLSQLLAAVTAMLDVCAEEHPKQKERSDVALRGMIISAVENALGRHSTG